MHMYTKAYTKYIYICENKEFKECNIPAETLGYCTYIKSNL